MKDMRNDVKTDEINLWIVDNWNYSKFWMNTEIDDDHSSVTKKAGCLARISYILITLIQININLNSVNSKH